MATEVFILRMETKGAGKVASDISNVGQQSQKAVRILQTLRNLLVGLAFLRAASHAVGFVDSLKDVQNALTQVTGGTKELAEAQKFLFKSAEQNRVAFADSADLYVRLAKALKPLGIEEETVRQTTDLMTKAIRLSGKTMKESQNDMERFAGELARGTFSAEMMKNILERYPRIAQAIGQHFNIASGEIEAFAKNNPGLLTTQTLIQALQADAANLEAEFSRLKVTLSDALTNFMDRLKEYLATAPAAAGATNAIASAINFLASNMNLVIGTLTALALVIGVQLAQAAIPKLIASIGQLNVSMAMTGWGAWFTAIGIAIGFAIAFAEPIGKIAQSLFGLQEPLNSTVIGFGLVGAVLAVKVIPMLLLLGAQIVAATTFLWTKALAVGAWTLALNAGTIATGLANAALGALIITMGIISTAFSVFIAIISSPVFVTLAAAAATVAAGFAALGVTWEDFTAVVKDSWKWIKSWFDEGTVLGKLLEKIQGTIDEATKVWDDNTSSIRGNTDALQENIDSLHEWRKAQEASWEGKIRDTQYTEKLTEAIAIFAKFADHATGSTHRLTNANHGLSNSFQSVASSASNAASAISSASRSGGGGGGGSSGGGGGGGNLSQYGTLTDLKGTFGFDLSASNDEIQAERNTLVGQALQNALKATEKMIADGRLLREEAQQTFDALFEAANQMLSGGSAITLPQLSTAPGGSQLTKYFEEVMGEAITKTARLQLGGLGMQGAPVFNFNFGQVTPVFGGATGSTTQSLSGLGAVLLGGGHNISGGITNQKFGFANGGSAMVNGPGGIDKVLAMMKVSAGEKVQVLTPSQQRRSEGGRDGGVVEQNIIVTLNLPDTVTDAQSFRRTAPQIEAELHRAVQRAGARR